jgi:biopolymer transport protein ExbB/TolQ
MLLIHWLLLLSGILAYEYVSSRRKDVAKALATEQQKRREMERAVRERAQLQEMNEQQNMIIASLAARLEMLEERLQEDHAKRQRRFFGLLPGSA